MEEKKLLVEARPHGCVEITQIRANNNEKLTSAQLEMQNGLNDLLQSLTEQNIREELTNLSVEDPLTTSALLRITNRQMEIAEEYHNLRWDQMVDYALLDKCAGDMTVINQQTYSYDEPMKRDTVRIIK
jgi:hypothetical protein